MTGARAPSWPARSGDGRGAIRRRFDDRRHRPGRRVPAARPPAGRPSWGWPGSSSTPPPACVIEVEGPPAVVATFAAGARRPGPAAGRRSTSVEVARRRRPSVTTGSRSGPASAGAGGDARVTGRGARAPTAWPRSLDPADRRYRYAFTNCTNCGPRYTIVTTIPYDRPNTTMAAFAMCAACRAEYDDPGDRRFHAQPVCCPACGPQLDAPIDDVAAALRAGEIVAVKGLGGYHLAALASSETAVARLRARKHREDKPFAVMVADVGGGRRAVRRRRRRRRAAGVAGPTDRAAADARPARPSLRRWRPGIARARACMLPYTPLHHLLLAAVGAADRADVGQRVRRADRLPGRRRPRPAGADRRSHAWRHDRPIHIRVDDSVVRVVDGAPYPLRRSRGYAPAPITRAVAPTPLPAAGLRRRAEVDDRPRPRSAGVRLAPHRRPQELRGVPRRSARPSSTSVGSSRSRPEVVAHDLHPDYLSTTFAARAGRAARARRRSACSTTTPTSPRASPTTGSTGPVIGVAFDGTGYGTDGTVWGGEVLVADLDGFERVGWLAPVPLPGRRRSDRRAVADGRLVPRRARRPRRGSGGAARAERALGRGRGDGPGRRGVAADVVGGPAVRRRRGARSACARRATYEGQAAIELEAIVDPAVRGAYPMAIDGPVLRGADLVGRRAGRPPGRGRRRRRSPPASTAGWRPASSSAAARSATRRASTRSPSAAACSPTSCCCAR